jgi:hypothetical protein
MIKITRFISYLGEGLIYKILGISKNPPFSMALVVIKMLVLMLHISF